MRIRTFLIAAVVAAGSLAAMAPTALAFAPVATSASSVEFTTATLNGTVNPQGVQLGDCHFEYVDAQEFGDFGFQHAVSAPCVPAAASIPADSTAHAVSAHVTGLTAGYGYHFRLVVANTVETERTASAAQQFFAAPAHSFSASIAGSGTDALSEPTDVAVDQSSHDIYVADPAEFRVERFTAAGQFVLMFGKGVDATSGGDVCTAASGDTCQAGSRGSSPGAFVGEFKPEGGAPQSDLYLAVDSRTGDVYVGDPGDGVVQKFDEDGALLTSWGEGGRLAGPLGGGHPFSIPGLSYFMGGIAVDPSGNLFVIGGAFERYEFAPDGTLRERRFTEGTGFGPGLELAVDAADNVYYVGNPLLVRAPIEEKVVTAGIDTPSQKYGGFGLDPGSRDLYISEPVGRVDRYAGSCNPESETCESLDVFGEGLLDEPQGVAVDESTGAVYVADTGNHRVAVFSRLPYLPAASASATPLTETSEQLEGEVKLAGAGPLTGCHFDIGSDTHYSGQTHACTPAISPGSPASADTPVAAEFTGLAAGTEYHYRVVTQNADGSTASYDQTFETLPLPPVLGSEAVSAISSDTAVVHDTVSPGGGDKTYHTSYRVEYLTQEEFEAGGGEPWSGAASTSPVDAGSARTPQALSQQLRELAPDTRFRYRVVAENASGTAHGPSRGFTTLPHSAFIDDLCANAHVRQQTSAALLLDCRAYELVSAGNAAGYDVESDLVPGQTPFGGYPDAGGRVLYGVHNGGIPGTGNPTNRGVDPYVARRGAEGWSTEYVGIPANGTPSDEAYGSPLLEADAGLDTFAFGGAGICSPCFADGSTGVPIHLPSGDLVQGMAGPEEPGPSEPAGVVDRHLSADGSHLIFGSTSKYAPEGNENGDLTLYDRDLRSEETHVVSRTPGGATMTGAGIAELDVSADGSRVLIGRKVGEDSAGNPYYHLYMDVNDSSHSIDLMPTTTSGALFAGMTDEGSKVFFTSADPLTADDEDTGADLYVADVTPSGATLSRVSTGAGAGPHGPGNSDSCNPVPNSAHSHWNALDAGQEDCGVVAIGGGGGIAPEDGTAYFLSPELLDGPAHGIQDAPNLYVARPGAAPKFVTTLESALDGPQPPAEGRLLSGRLSPFEDAVGLAVDHQTGDVYVLDDEAQTVERFDSQGNPAAFTASVPYVEGNELTGSPFGAFAETSALDVSRQLAVDNDPSSPSYGDLYVPDFSHQAVRKFSSSGQYLSSISVSTPSGVAVDQANGHVYVTSFAEGETLVFDANGNPVAPASFAIEPFTPTAIAVDNGGRAYVASEAGTSVFDAAGNETGILDPNSSEGVAVDPSNGHVYVDEGSRVVEFDSSESEVGTVTQPGELVGSVGGAVDAGGDLYASTDAGLKVAQYGPFGILPSPLIDSPVVLDSVGEPGVLHTADFQVSENGAFAALPSTLALAGGEEEPAGHHVIYRYAVGSGRLDCVSCIFTGAAAEGESSLAPDGLSLADSGQVFFDSSVALTGGDTDNRQDAYEWEPAGTGNCEAGSPTYSRYTSACQALISAGTSTFDSGLLGISRDATDAYFFTRDSLTPRDVNGPTVKIYDARAAGGFPFEFPPVGCRASDECHGPASTTPAAPQISSESGTAHNVVKAKGCKRGFRPKQGKCVKRHRARRHHHRRAGHNGGGGK